MEIHISVLRFLVGVCLISCILSAKAQRNDSGNLTAYEMLQRFDFPKGIIPEGAKSYDLHEDGSFALNLDGNCRFGLEGSYTLNYKNRITGRIKMGSLSELQGVSVKILFVWLGINEVKNHEGQLNFYVGPLSASFDLSNFEESPRCGCGFDCVTSVSDS